MFALGLRPLWLQIVFIFFSAQFNRECLAQESVSSGDSSATAQARNPSSSTAPLQSTSTSSAPAQTHTIEVGLADHKFRPESTEAAVGDVRALPTLVDVLLSVATNIGPDYRIFVLPGKP